MQHIAYATRTTPPSPTRFVYAFGVGRADGGASMKALLGGKGANLAEMARIGLPVPPGFTVSTEACAYYYTHESSLPPGLEADIEKGVKAIERLVGRRLGDTQGLPLLLSIRSGARDSMPGMMDTIVDLGLNDETTAALARATGDERFALDCHRRFIQTYGNVVLGIGHGEDEDPFEAAIARVKLDRRGDEHISDVALDADDLRELLRRFRALVKERIGNVFPEDPWQQVDGAVRAVFGSWMNDRAVVYRRKYGIPHDWGTAVNVQAMVYGNAGDSSGSGVGFTRDPATGEKVLYGEFLRNAQGEDVVSGARTPLPLAELAEVMPAAHAELVRIVGVLESHFKDVQDFEFTIEDGTVWMLQTRNAKRTGRAAFRVACEMVREGLIDRKTAVKRVPADQLDQLLSPVFERAALEGATVLTTGLPAGPGAASGRIYFSADRAVEAAQSGQRVLLVRVETSPEDLRGMIAAEGFLTARGGVSSHAALVARQMGKVCITGAAAVHIDAEARTVSIEGQRFAEGDWLSIDGTSGQVFAGELATGPSEVLLAVVHDDAQAKESHAYRDFAELMTWCDEVTRLEVRANADTPEQTRTALAFGAKGVGLCRTEHMFFQGDRIDAMRAMILAESLEDREVALAGLLPLQRDDFAGMFRVLAGRPATIRLLDPPLHEFLPQARPQQAELASKLGVSAERIVERVEGLHEENPMLGFRGCRLGIAHPEISAMQARAIFEAAVIVQSEGIPCLAEIMIPLVGFRRELDLQAEIVRRVAAEVMNESGTKIDYLIGTMIEVPRAALTAGEIAATAQFFSFGTNDLTQTTLGMSRDDSGSFLPLYVELDVVPQNPFASIDASGVGELMRIAVEKGRASRPDLELGICGEHGGDPASIRLCHALGLDYVSCSPFRVPVARLAAAQAALDDSKRFG